MAIGIYIRPQSMNQAQYNEIMQKLAAAGQSTPAGRTEHVCFGTGEHLAVFDVWDSEANLNSFFQTLEPIVEALGLNMGQPSIEPVVNAVRG
jgi:hypothetical protein